MIFRTVGLFIYIFSIFAFLSLPTQGAYIIQLESLIDFSPPVPPNPVVVLVRVTCLNPLTVTDDSIKYVEVITPFGHSFKLGQLIKLEADWDGEKLTARSWELFNRIYPRYLVIGNSLCHSAPGIWNNNIDPGWGMNASSIEKDYVHKITEFMKYLDSRNAVAIQTSLISGQPGGKITDMLATLPAFKNFKPDLITVQVGENDRYMGLQAYRVAFLELITKLNKIHPKPRIIVIGPWNPQSSYQEGSWEHSLELLEKEICDSHAIPFVSIKDVSQDPLSCDDKMNPIKWHPNDHGMAGIASNLIEIIAEELTP